MRFLYIALFSWIVFSGGRFTAPFLKIVTQFDDTLIGASIAIQLLFGALLAPYGCVVADKMELKYPHRGRISTLLVGIVIATVVFEFHWVVNLLFRDNKCNCRQLKLLFHMILRILFSIFTSMLVSVLDGATLSYLKEIGVCESEYGKERLYGAVGWAAASVAIGYFLDTSLGFDVFFISAPIGALLCVLVGYTYMYEMPNPIHHQLGTYGENAVDYLNSATPLSSEIVRHQKTCLHTNESKTNISPIMGRDSPALKAGYNTCISSRIIEQDFDLLMGQSNKVVESSNIGTKSRRNDANLTVNILKAMVQTYSKIGFLVSIILLNIGTSIVENLIFLYFQDLGTSYATCGISVLVTVLFEIPIFYFAPKLLVRFGPELLQQIACIAYIARVVGYTFIPKGHGALVLLFEPLHGVTYGCMQVSSVNFAAQASLDGYESSSQGVLAFVAGVGSTVGLVAGGWIEDTLGPIILYRSYATAVALGIIVFYISRTLDSHSIVQETERFKQNKNQMQVQY